MEPPASGCYLKSVQESSKKLRLHENINIREESIHRLLFSPAFTSSFKRVSASHGLALPLNFSSPLDELNVLSILSLLNFASGYRIPLYKETGRGAWDNIRALVFSLYLSSATGNGDLTSSRGLQSTTETTVAELMRVNVHVERPHETIPGIVVGELGGPIHELVKLITGVLQETGGILVDQGYPNLGAFVAEGLKKAQATPSGPAEVEIILEHLVKGIPGFRDMDVVDGQPIYCFKKALFLIHAINVRFGARSPPPFPVPSTSQIPVFSDNVLPSMLIHLGVIDVSSSPKLSTLFPNAGSEDSLRPLLQEPSADVQDTVTKGIPLEGPLVDNEQAYILRAAAIDACDMIVDTAHSLATDHITGFADSLTWIKDIHLPDLDMWLWAVAKDRADYRALPRFAARNTVWF